MRARSALTQALQNITEANGWPWPAKTQVDPPRDAQHGDLATNLAMVLAKEAGKPPREIAAAIVEAMGRELPGVECDIAGPGFINFRFSPAFWQATVKDILDAGAAYGGVNVGQGKRVQVEYVSANPTGPLHIGHGRGAAIGDSLLKLLRFMGYSVSGEYYLNDAGRQMKMLGASVLARARQQRDPSAPFLEDGYKGEYIADIGREMLDIHGDRLLEMPEPKAIGLCRDKAVEIILGGIRKDLGEFGAEHEVWFSEKSLVEDGEVAKTLQWLKDQGLADEEEGALWFRTMQFGDDKDRVLRKSDGELTYFASDIAYHLNKYQRGFDLLIDVWGADHHGYIPRMKSAVKAMGRDPETFQVILVQLVNLLRDGEPIAMSTRAGKYETLEDVLAEVGSDAARFIFLSRKSDSKLDFDLELVKQKTMENPVYYVQYAHARINSVQRKAEERGVAMAEPTPELLALLDTPEDIELTRFLERFPDILVDAARDLSVHSVSHYLLELAGQLHRYYTLHQVLNVDDSRLIQARLLLLSSVAQVLRNGLALLGVRAPESM